MDLGTFEKQFIKEERIRKDRNQRKIMNEVFDERTISTLVKLARKGLFTRVSGCVSTGKEANVFRVITEDGEQRAIKIYRIETSNFKDMWPYIEDDPRFAGLKRNKKELVSAWCQKEYRNLCIADSAGVRVPKPFGFMQNVLVMQYLGREESSPLLKNCKLEDPKGVFDSIASEMKKLYDAGLVHADISEFNVLMHEGEPFLIDFAQAVLLSHPKSGTYLERDISNIVKYFKRLGVSTPEEELHSYITRKTAKNP
ncbi:MAG: serine protein kinase RIO [Candidatus Diapherotrites archaeon]|nr:serine protein kinase RIO [Candidatus Diapherotrites archaeon]